MNPDRLDHLIHGLLDGTLERSGREELDAALLDSRDARDRYRSAVALHAALSRRTAAPEEGAEKLLVLPSRSRWPRRLAAIAAVLVLGIGGTLLLRHPAGPRASLASASGLQWAGGVELAAEDDLPVATPLEIVRGTAELVFPSGARVALEGPCRFRLDRPEALTVLHGQVSVHAPKGAEGFHVDTPGGRFVDLGTRFGLAVGSDGDRPVVLTEVYEGEVEVQASRKETERLYGGDSRAVVHGESGPLLLTSLDASPVRVPKILLNASPQTERGLNLALGKPVTSPGYCIRPHGSVFPPANLTDGRTDDTGVPGDWSFWLAPNGENGEFTVDLGESETIARISLQNTSNRRIDDRGTSDFEAWISNDNVNFTRIVQGALPRIDRTATGSFPFHDFTFEPVRARYVKVVVTGHYRHRTRPADDPNQGGGLNEIRVFSE